MKESLHKPISIAALVVFRVVFGCIVLWAASRTLLLGWVDKFYLQPDFHFKFYGFHWVEVPPAWLLYSLFGIMIGAAIGILLGWFYKINSFLFFIIFTYVELLDVTHYLNHYYLISVLALWMCFLPAHRHYSLDAWRKPHIKLTKVPRWVILAVQIQIAIVYFYAGIAKLHADWLIAAQPLGIWLARNSDMPLLGSLWAAPLTAHLFAWAGALYDLLIPFLLWWRKTWKWAYAIVVIFHLSTAMLFYIGVFPILMIGITIIFFPSICHQKIIAIFERIFILTLSKLKYWTPKNTQKASNTIEKTSSLKWMQAIFAGILIWQLLFPLRHWLYPGNVLWTEEGFRFAWKVMIVEKNATTTFTVVDKATQKESLVNNSDFLNKKQEVMMSYQPDLILQYAHYLADYYESEKGYKEAAVYVDAWVSLNGRLSRRLIDPQVDLAKEKNTLFHKSWIIPQEL